MIRNSSISADRLTRRFGSFTAGNHVSFDIKEGEIFGFLGPNGAGKTTTILMLVTLITPAEGSAQVAGMILCASREKCRSR